MKMPRFIKEYANYIKINGFDKFNSEIDRIVRSCERNFITADECMRLIVREKEFLIGKTDEQYKAERGL